MPRSLAFLAPTTQDQVIAELEQHGDEAVVVAGSTAVTIMLRQGLIDPRLLVSLGRLTELRRIQADNGQLALGATTTHREVELSPVVRAKLPVLASTFGQVANVRVRNAATVGGVVAEADYASDPPALFAVLDAEVDIVGPGGERSLPIREFLTGFYETALEPTEIVTRVRVPLPAQGIGCAYEKFVTRSSEDRPCVGVAALVHLEPDGLTCAYLRVAVGAAAEVPQRFEDVEARARGRQVDDVLAEFVAIAYADRIDPLSDMRGSSWYRREMVKVWVRRAILHARDDAVRGREVA